MLFYRFYNLKLDLNEYNGNLKLLVVTTSQISRNFVDVYLTPENVETSALEVGQIIEKQVLSTESSTSLEEDTNCKNIQDRAVARFFKISDYVLHCCVNEGIPDEELNAVTGVVSIIWRHCSDKFQVDYRTGGDIISRQNIIDRHK